MHAAFKTCQFCAHTLSVHERSLGSTCGKPACQQARVKLDLKAAAALRDMQRKAAQEMLASQYPVHAANNRFIAIVPSNDRPVTGLPARRIARFRHRLMQVITRAAQRRWSNLKDSAEENGYPEPATPLNPAQSRLMTSACTTCQGYCCQQGGEHAFLHPHAILAYWKRHPDHRPAQVLDAYLKHLPHKSVSDSCVYHGARGCTLEPDMMSHICHRYICRGAAQLLEVASELANVAIAATNNEIVTRVAPAPDTESQSSQQVSQSP